MKEAFLHYVWQFKKIENILDLKTTSGKKIEIINSGYYNQNSGPDFSLAKVLIDGIKWVGNIEIHLKASDWKKHNHTPNSSYKNIILHVVYEYDMFIEELEDNNIPTLELRSYISKSLIDNYNLLNKNFFSFIPCEKLFSYYLSKKSVSFSERFYIDKLEDKHQHILQLLKIKNNDWEAVLAATLAYGFGLKINAEAFEQIILLIDYKIIRKISSNPIQLEALFFGMTHSLEGDDEYIKTLKKEFLFLKSKYKISDNFVNVKYLRLRPANFPTIRLSQLANLLSQYQNLFSYVVGAKTLQQYMYLLDGTEASLYWKDHFVFGKKAKKAHNKKLSSMQKELIIFNVFLPIKFAYSMSINKSMEEEIINIIGELSVEKNSIINNFSKLGVKFTSALDSQAFLHLYKNKCENKQCLNCSIGFEILK